MDIPRVRHDVAEEIEGDIERVAVRESWPSSDVETRPVPLGSRLTTARLALAQGAIVRLS